MKVEFTYHEEFFRLALNNYVKIEQLKREHDKIRESFKHRKKVSDDLVLSLLAEKNDAIGQHALIAVIFCALSAEAYINDYAISRLSKNYLKSYLDKLDLLSKWVLIPRIVTGRQLDPGSEPIQNLSWLVALRNKLVHYKTRVLTIEQIEPSDFLWEDDAQKALDTVRNLVLALKEIDKDTNIDWLNK